MTSFSSRPPLSSAAAEVEEDVLRLPPNAGRGRCSRPSGRRNRQG